MIVIEKDIHPLIEEQKTLFAQLLSELREQQTQIFTREWVKNLKKIYLTGCGDSLFAAQGARFFFQEVLNIDVEVVEAMEFSRYVAPKIQEGTAVFGISNSGRVSRTVEALQEARHFGAKTVALTGSPDRLAVKVSEDVILGALPNIRSLLEKISNNVETDDQDFQFTELTEPGVLERLPAKIGLGSGINLLLFMLGAYFTSLAHLYTAAISLGLVCGSITEEKDAQYMAWIMDSVEAAVRTTKKCFVPTIEAAEQFREKTAFLYLGAGPSYATANLSAAKLFEQPHLNGVSQYLEEWAHLQFFYTRPDGVPVFLIVPPGKSRDRAIEQIIGIKELGGTTVAICSQDDQELAQMCDVFLPVVGNLPESFSPWMYGVPGQVFAVALLNLKGQPPIPPPYSFKKMMEVNFRQIYQSEILRR